MKTYEINKEEIKSLIPVAEGYKVIKYNGGTLQSFKYCEDGENMLGRVFKVDGDISACNWGLHFSKDPANVFNFYEPLGYNRYFKVRAYDKVIDNDLKSVTNIIEFVEEYDLMQYIELIKRYPRTAVSDSYAVSDSNAVSGSTAVSDSYGIRKCEAVAKSLFCYGVEGCKHYIFNKQATEERFNELRRAINRFNWQPKYDNFYELKGNKEWWALCFPKLMRVDNATAWSAMPQKMKEYIESLPEFDREIFEKITGNEE